MHSFFLEIGEYFRYTISLQNYKLQWDVTNLLQAREDHGVNIREQR